MLPLKLSLGVLVTLALFALTSAQEKTHDERCTVREGNGYRVDECDAKRFLQCKDGRCQCPDPASQIYTYRNEPIAPSRSRRSPGKKGGGFKKIAAGAVAGAATYHVASQAGKAINNGFTTTPKPPKYNKVFACYSRVGGQCALSHTNVEKIPTAPSTPPPPSTPAAADANATTTTAPGDNSTVATTSTTTAAPVAAAQTAEVDITKIPKCVQYAICKPASPSGNSSSGFHYKVDFDPRIGTCECADGYKKNSRDLCEKVSSGAGKTVGSGAMLVILSSLLLNKIFV